MNFFCSGVLLGITVLLHEGVNLVLKAVNAVEYSVDVAVDFNLGDVLLRTLFSSLAEQN
jgi:hypothetical protein